MQSSGRSLSLAQLCLLAAFLAGLIYYLETGRVEAETNVPFWGAPLHPASGKMHILVTGALCAWTASADDAASRQGQTCDRP